MKEISSRSLRSSELPSRSARWLTIARFARTFDGYRHWGSFDRCAEIANQKRQRTLNELRTCLFFEQRRWRHFGERPNRKAMRYIRGLLKKIRLRLTRREAQHR
jgi:hypothetical protein